MFYRNDEKWKSRKRERENHHQLIGLTRVREYLHARARTHARVKWLTPHVAELIRIIWRESRDRFRGMKINPARSDTVDNPSNVTEGIYVFFCFFFV